MEGDSGWGLGGEEEGGLGQPWRTMDLFLHLPESALIGLAILLPNVNDIFPGKGPDLGANEAKTDLPVYGFRA